MTVSYMRKLGREAPPGTKWSYKTGETNLIGVLVSSATKKNLSEYLSEKIWQPFGMELDASWMLGPTGHEISGCCIQASTRDYARFGLFILGGGIAQGKPVLPDGWIAEATTTWAETNRPEYGYGYQWWTLKDGSYAARGHFRPGHLYRSETETGDRLQQQLALRQRSSGRRSGSEAHHVLPAGATGDRQRGKSGKVAGCRYGPNR